MRKPTAIRTLPSLAVLALYVCGVSTAGAAPAQLFTSASQPPMITSPTVTVTPIELATDGTFDIDVGVGLTCPDT